MPTGRSLCRSGRSSPHTRRSSSHCHSTRRISMSPKTSRASSQRLRSRKKSGQDPSRNRAHGFGRRLLQQVPRQTGLGSPQAGRALRHHSEDGAGICGDPASQEVSRRRACDGRQNAATWDQDRLRPQSADLGLPPATFRQSGLLLLLGCAGRRRAAGPRRSATEIRRCREHVSRRSLHLRSCT